MLNHQKSVVYDCSLFPFGVSRQVGFSGRGFLDNYSLALEIQRIASINFRASARLRRLAQ